MEEKKYTVYIHTVIENNKKYVGITCRDPQLRWGNNGSQYKGQVFYNAIQKYGWDNMTHEIIAKNLTQEEACNMEIELIKKYNTTDKKFGYNRTTGGDFSNTNIIYGEEFKKKMSERNSGEGNPMYGKHHTEEAKKKISKRVKGQTRTEEQKKKLSECRIGSKGTNNRKVTIDGLEFESITACSKYLGKTNSLITGWLNGGYMPKEYIERGLRFCNDETTIYKPFENNKSWLSVVCEDVVYDNLTDCAKKYNVNPATMRYWLNNDAIPATFSKLGLRYLSDQTTTNNKEKRNCKKAVICEGKIFNTIKECSNFYEVNYKKMLSWLKDNSKMPKSFLEMGLSLL